MTDIEFVSQNRTGLGASRIAHSKLATLHETVVEWNEGRGFLLRLHRGDKSPRPWKDASFRYAIEPDGVATLIDLSMTYTFGFGPLAPLLERLARGPMQRNLDRLAARSLSSNGISQRSRTFLDRSARIDAATVPCPQV